MTYIDTLDIGCGGCGATYVRGERHECPTYDYAHRAGSDEQDERDFEAARSQVTRPRPIHPAVFSVAELDAWLVKRIDQETAAVHDGETIAHIGWESHKSAVARYGTLITVRELIEAWAAEERDAQPDAAEAWDRLKAEGYTELELRRAAGDR